MGAVFPGYGYVQVHETIRREACNIILGGYATEHARNGSLLSTSAMQDILTVDCGNEATAMSILLNP